MHDVLRRVAALVDVFQARAGALDADARFPADNIADLCSAGVLAAVLPSAVGGLDWGIEAARSADIAQLLRLAGRGHLATGRLLEGHVNVVRLMAAYGSAAQMAAMANHVLAGEMFGLWVTEGHSGVRVSRDGVLDGAKVFCSGAGFLRHAMVTAQPETGPPVLVLVRLDDMARAQPSAMRLQGMRSAVTGAVELTGLVGEVVGAPGDYLRQPLFSAGAWRTSAVTLGGIDALVTAAAAGLAARGRGGEPHQLARMGRMLIARETAALWVEKAARIGEDGARAAGDVAGYVNLARMAVEAAALEALGLVQRCLGLSAFVAGNAVELVARDLATYLRQPAPDETLTEAAAWFSAHEMPA